MKIEIMLQNIAQIAMIGTRMPWMMKRYESFRTEKYTINEKIKTEMVFCYQNCFDLL
jgi:hypothetical protein